MQQMEETAVFNGIGANGTSSNGTERKRVEAVVETLATLRSQGESLAEAAHDARNMVTALGLYCDLLDEPGVLATPYLHYASELRLVASASRRLVEKLLALDTRESPVTSLFDRTASAVQPPAPSMAAGRPDRTRRWDLTPAEPIGNLAGELQANRNLLAALAGPAIALTVDTEGGAQAVRLTAEDLTRILVNLVKNATEAMPSGGRIQVGLREQPASAGTANCLALTVEDNGPGIPPTTLESIFDSGYTTRTPPAPARGGWLGAHRGLGLSIVRSIVEAAGGRIHAANRAQGGTRLEIELPVRSH